MKESIKKWIRAQHKELLHYLTYKCEWTESKWIDFIKTNFQTDVTDLEKSMLEVGCGMSGPIIYLRFANAYGLDPLILDYYRRGMISRNTSSSLINGVGEFLPFKNNVFDIVLCLNVLDHVIDPNKVILEIKRVCKKGSKVFIWVHVFNIPKLFKKFIEIIDTTHPHHFSMQEIVSLLDAAGLRVIYTNTTKNRRKQILLELIRSKKLKRFVKFLGSILLGLNDAFIICEVDKNEK